jgi:hypothetical protein
LSGLDKKPGRKGQIMALASLFSSTDKTGDLNRQDAKIAKGRGGGRKEKEKV